MLVEDIGADVNLGGGGFVGKMGRAQLRGGRGDHTPICLAVLSGKKSMVELLLSLGATNVHPALQLAREQVYTLVFFSSLAHSPTSSLCT